MSGIGSGPPASELPGKMALLRKTLEHDMDRQDIALPSPLVQVKLDIDGSGRRRIAIPRDELFRIRDIFWKNAYGLPDAWPTRDRLQVVDIGANVGCFALYAQRWAREVTVYSFEPNPQVFIHLRFSFFFYGYCLRRAAST